MYTLAVRREFIARHFLIGGDWGAENQPHAHPYILELQLAGAELDAHGFLVDIVEVNAHLDALVAHYRDSLLNDLPEFSGLNPSLENFARLACTALEGALPANVGLVRVQLWENASAWAAFELLR
jgi:6-pyruvoyltetrahydropterin/6-carboxytetrahydropterin synthase